MRAIACCLLLAVALAGCASLPRVVERAPSSAFTETGKTRLGRALAPAVAANPGKTGVRLLGDARDSFAARILSTRSAERSIDAQYYILRADMTGGLFCAELWQAAERGVRVRLLLDDNNTKGMDEMIAALDAHPNIEVRLFNPFANRAVRLADFAVDFARVQRRMHNKSLTVDNQIAIVGGRNIGDEYFGIDTPVEFADVDALTAGAVVPDISAGFDAYWNSPLAYPAASLIRAAPASAAPIRDAWTKLAENPDAARYVDALRTTTLARELQSGKLPLEWVSARLVQDAPSKILRPPQSGEPNVLARLETMLGTPARELDLVSSYFVPTRQGTAALSALARRGAKVRVLTNYWPPSSPWRSIRRSRATPTKCA